MRKDYSAKNKLSIWMMRRKVAIKDFWQPKNHICELPQIKEGFVI